MNLLDDGIDQYHCINDPEARTKLRAILQTTVKRATLNDNRGQSKRRANRKTPSRAVWCESLGEASSSSFAFLHLA